VTVPAADIALLDLGGDYRDAVAVANETHDLLSLRRTLTVIEVEDSEVGFAAVRLPGVRPVATSSD